jgi:hypothetical protein
MDVCHSVFLSSIGMSSINLRKSTDSGYEVSDEGSVGCKGLQGVDLSVSFRPFPFTSAGRLTIDEADLFVYQGRTYFFHQGNPYRGRQLPPSRSKYRLRRSVESRVRRKGRNLAVAAVSAAALHITERPVTKYTVS